jgi:tetratricopeptide (TPR) repeat protein
MPRDQRRADRYGQKKRVPFAARAPRTISALVLLVCWLGCSRRDPQTAFDHATHTFWQGDLHRAQEEAERGYREFHAVGPGWAWKFRILEAKVLNARGMSDCVLDLLASQRAPVSSSNNCALALPGPEPAPPSGELAVDRRRLEGSAYGSKHLFPEAEHSLGEAAQLCAGIDYPACVHVTGARGALAMERGDFTGAQALFAQALGLARSGGDRFVEANALLDLTWSALFQEHYDEAMDWSAEASRLAAAINAGYVAQTALGNLGWAYYKLGESEKAFGLFLEAKNRAHQIGATASEVNWLTTAGYVYLDAHDYEAARQSYQQALDLAQQINSKEDIINALMSLALVSERTGKLKEARDYADRTIAMAPAEGNRLDVLYPMLVKGHVAARLHDSAEAEKIFREVEQDPKSHVFLKWEAEHSLAQLYEDENQPDSADREYRAALSTFETARSSLQHEESELPFPANASRIYDDYIHFLVARGKTDDALRGADYSRARTLAEGLGLLAKGSATGPPELNAQEISRRARGVLLFYWLGEKQSYLWAITPQKASLFPLPPGAEIEAAVGRYRKALAGPQDVLDSANQDGRWLYGTLIAPAQALLTTQHSGAKARPVCRSCSTAEAVPFPESASFSGSPKVFIIPDGSLNNLNFETLLVAEPKLHYWIEDATIAEASSLRVLAASYSSQKKRARRLLLVGDSVAPSKEYPELPKAAVQMESVARHFPAGEQRILSRGQATPAAYLESHPEQFSYIHFVAHGTASRLIPLDSAIVLSKSGAENDSFKLYAREIIRHPLRADLVTISACYGAGERSYSGEGLVGLSWAFLRAGAHNVIAALWEATDVSTEQLMSKFYDELDRGATPDAALRAAKLSLLRGSPFHNPFYWAPFQLYAGQQ